MLGAVTYEELLDFAVGLESAVWRALVDGDQAADEALLADRFVGVYPTGVASRSDHAGQLASGPTVVEYSISAPAVLEISDDALLLSYEARYRRPRERSVERMYVSSLWMRDGRRWLNLFSQDTPAVDPAGG